VARGGYDSWGLNIYTKRGLVNSFPCDVPTSLQPPFVGEFEVREIRFNANATAVLSLAIDFIQRCPVTPHALYGQLRFNSSVPLAEQYNCSVADCVMSLWSPWMPQNASDCLCDPLIATANCVESRTRSVLVRPDMNGIQCGPEVEQKKVLILKCDERRRVVPNLFQFSNLYLNRNSGKFVRECGATDPTFLFMGVDTIYESFGGVMRNLYVGASDWSMRFRALQSDRFNRPLLTVGTRFHSFYSILLYSHLSLLLFQIFFGEPHFLNLRQLHECALACW
jgi:hypothetical protein